MRIPHADTAANMYSTLMDTTESDLLGDENAANENLINSISDDPTDGFSLTDQQKLVILIIAVSLFFVTLLTTLCIVSPCCYVSKLIKKLQIKTGDHKLSSSNPIFKQYISPETKSFQLTVVPQFVEKQKLNLNLSKNDKLHQPPAGQNEPINLYNNEPTNLKRKLLRDIFQSKEINCNTLFLNHKNLDVEDAYEKWTTADGVKCENNLIYGLNGLSNGGLNNGSHLGNQLTTGKESDPIEIICSLRTDKVASPANKGSNLRLALHLKQIKYLPLKANGLEPSFYCLITGQGANSAFRKATNRKLSAKLNSLLYYQSETFKPRTLNPTINLKYYSEELSKSVLKEAKLQIRIMAVEKHANDTCLGETVISLKQVLNDEKTIEKNSLNEKEDVFKCYKLQRPKEIKGELLLSICWLPTSRRATFAFSKANLNNQLNIIDFNQNYFIRVIMCCNGKKMAKKKTCSSTKLDWQENETLTFDLTNLNEYQLEQLCFLVVLVCTQETITEQNVSSPSSPDSPVDQLANGFMKSNNTMEALKSRVDKTLQKKDNTPIGHFVLTSDLWNQVTHEPRKQIKRWVKLI